MERVNLDNREVVKPKLKILLDEKSLKHEGDFEKLQKLAEGISLSCKTTHEVMIVGGVALRLLESAVGIDHENGVMSSNDVDLVYIGSDERRRIEIQESIQKKLKIRVDVQRMAKKEERDISLFPQMVITDKGDFIISALKGSVTESMPANHFELLEVEVGRNSICVAPPAMLWHFYATRSLGDGKRKDWLKNKFNRIRKLKPMIVDKFGLKMQSPNDLKEWEVFRKKVKCHHLAKLLHEAVDLHDRLGRPLERFGLATLIR